MVLVRKWQFFHLFFLGNIGEENVFYDILQRKTNLLGYKNKKFKKSKNYHFFKEVNPWFSSKKGHYFKILFLGNTGKENVFYDILEQRNVSLGYKNKKFKTTKNWHFSKGVNPWFLVQKWPSFQNLFLGNTGKENVCYDILELKNTFLG